jgi:DME family drug/metabolite transporter
VTSDRRGILYVAGAALLWSTGGIGIKAVAAPPLTVACYRSAIAGLALLAFFRPRAWSARPAFLIAVVSYAACVTTFVVATKWTTAANAIFLQYSGVVWVLLASPIVLGEALVARDIVAVVVALAGMVLFFVGKLEAHFAGDAVALLSGVCYAAVALSLRRERGASAEAAVVFGNLLTAVMLFPVVFPAPWVPARAAAILVFLGVVQIAGAYVLFLRGLMLVPATQASIVGLLEPVANPIWVFLLLGERPGGFALAGGAIVLGAIAWRTLRGGQPVAELPAPD